VIFLVSFAKVGECDNSLLPAAAVQGTTALISACGFFFAVLVLCLELSIDSLVPMIVVEIALLFDGDLAESIMRSLRDLGVDAAYSCNCSGCKSRLGRSGFIFAAG
jgi:hypothetical protein